jgi:serine/threonine protein kinase/Leucine-rich repeat (LRR) protein
MPDPTRQTHATERTADDSPGALDPTLARPGDAPDPLARAAGPQFAAPAHAGELGTFGRYRVLQKLGQGGMGAVYLAYDSTLERKVALKVMLGGGAADPAARERFLREARAVAKVKSDHVVTIFDVGEHAGTPFIAMEYLLGLPLDQYLRQKGELPLAQVLRVCEETARGLAAVHDHGLIHRDIKPGNLWLEAPHGRVKLLDFGLARIETEDTHLTGTGTVMGTPAFMSPEQGRGKKLDPRSDLFTLGVLLYRLCTGKMPFVGDTTMALLTALAVDTPTAPRALNPDLPDALEAVILKLLQKNPADRYQSATEATRALYAVAAGPLPVVVALPVPAFAVAAQTQNVWESIDDDSRSAAVPLAAPTPTEVEAPPTPRPARRKPERAVSKTPIYLAAAGLLIACAVLAVVLWPKKKPTEEAKEPDKPNVPGKKEPPKPPAVPPAKTGDRQIAEFVLTKGGGVFFNAANGLGRADKVGELPAGEIEVVGVELFGKQWASVDMERVRGLKGLTMLKIHDTSVGESGLKAFAGTTQLTELHVELSPIPDAALANFAGNTNLQVLSLVGTRIGNPGLLTFAACKNLTHLSVSDTDVDDTGLKALADNPNLLGLTIGSTKATGRTLERFTANPKLQILSAFQLKLTDEDLVHLKKWRELWHITISDNPIGDDGLAHLVGLPLSYLDLRGTKVSDGGLVHLEKLPKLTALYLSSKNVTVSEKRVKELAAKLPACRIEWNGVTIEPPDPNRTAAERFLARGGQVRLDKHASLFGGADGPKQLPKEPFVLVECHIADGEVTAADTALLGSCPALRGVALVRAKLPDAALAPFAGSTTLTYVNLGHNPLTDAGLAHLKGCPLTFLDVQGSKITDKGLDALVAPGRFQLCDLVTLIVNDTAVTDAALARLAGKGPEKYLGFARTAITDAGLAHLKGLSVADLDVTGTAVTDEGLVHLEGVIGLQKLNLTGTKVTAPGVKRLQTKFPRCVVKWQPAAVVPAGTDRAAAEAVLALGGQVRSAAMSAKETITDPKLLPPGLFLLGYVLIETKDQPRAQLDAALAACAACKELHTVVMNGPLVTNDMVARFKDCPKLNRLTISGTLVTGAGLTPFKAHPALRIVSLEKADIGDEVLDALSANPELTFLDVRGTKVSAAKVAAFAKAAPKCRVQSPGGTTEPTKK